MYGRRPAKSIVRLSTEPVIENPLHSYLMHELQMNSVEQELREQRHE